MQINDPAIVAELMQRHEAYERALIDNDVATLEAMFWNSAHAVRYGVAENLYGTEQINAFRKGRPKVNLEREIARLEILTIGDSAGIVNLEFRRPVNGTETHGRQTQFWFRFKEGWRIASAHVSLMPGTPSYVTAAAGQLNVPLMGGTASAVGEDFDRLAAVAHFLMEFPLPQGVEAAPVFQP